MMQTLKQMLLAAAFTEVAVCSKPALRGGVESSATTPTEASAATDPAEVTIFNRWAELSSATWSSSRFCFWNFHACGGNS